MSKCPNCGAKLSCGCQRRTSSDGTQACTNCVNSVKKTNSISAPIINTNRKSFVSNRNKS